MTTTDIEGIKKDLADINSFVRERFEPVSREVGLLREETERISRSVNSAMERERSVRRNELEQLRAGRGTADRAVGRLCGHGHPGPRAGSAVRALAAS